MTAEIVILNQYGVALAADSAVSIGDKKVYNSANKLFALSKEFPVGVMIYSNAKFMSAPWEVLIKYFRQHVLAGKSFASLKEYCDLFMNFLETTNIVPPENEKDFCHSVVLQTINGVAIEIDKAVRAKIAESGSISESETGALAASVIGEWLKTDLANQNKQNSKATKKQVADIKSAYASYVKSQVSDAFSSLKISKTILNKICSCILGRLACRNFSPMSSGVVFAGFGESELYPSVYSYDVSGRVCGLLHATPVGAEKISVGQRGVVMPFAQREMADTFIGGIDPSFMGEINSQIGSALMSCAQIVEESGAALTDDQKEKINSGLQDRAKKFVAAVSGVQQQYFAQPVLSSVAALPIDELAAMAESLVNLTSFKRKVTMVPESVGGPVDVAVISKGDGFIWIKRKHYFRPELNQQYFSRAFK